MAALAQRFRRSCFGLLGRSKADRVFHSQLSNLGWPCLRIGSHKPLCSAFWSVLQLYRFDFVFVEQVSSMTVA